MDAARSTRKYPSYTTTQLEAFVAEGVTEFRSAEKVADIAAEVAARKAGLSVHRPERQMTDIQTLTRQLRELRAEMKASGITKTSPFNGGMDMRTYRYNSRRFELETKLAAAKKREG